MLTKQNALLGRDARAENSRVKGPGRTAPPHDLSQVLLELEVSFPGYLWPVICLYPHLVRFLAAHTSLRLDGVRQKDFREVGRTYYGLPYWFLLLIDCLCFMNQRSSPPQIHPSQLTSTSTSTYYMQNVDYTASF